jgi:hypothetical protein
MTKKISCFTPIYLGTLPSEAGDMGILKRQGQEQQSNDKYHET